MSYIIKISIFDLSKRIIPEYVKKLKLNKITIL